ncbi:hypothetical protein NMY22_g13126 [Coprinellus aureogranulatus]|nr:hypothetical protein NMY22_g13126 [Coprinellus aureogranulatus]
MLLGHLQAVDFWETSLKRRFNDGSSVEDGVMYELYRNRAAMELEDRHHALLARELVSLDAAQRQEPARHVILHEITTQSCNRLVPRSRLFAAL